MGLVGIQKIKRFKQLQGVFASELRVFALATIALSTHPTQIRAQEIAPNEFLTSDRTEESCSEGQIRSVGTNEDAGISKSIELANKFKAMYTDAATGARKAMAIMYQSCDALRLPPYDPAVHGEIDSKSLVRVKSTEYPGHWDRKILKGKTSNVAATHYYHKNIHPEEPTCVTGGEPIQSGPDGGSSYCEKPKCRDMSKTPVLYEWGAKMDYADFKNKKINLLAPQNFKDQDLETKRKQKLGVNYTPDRRNNFLGEEFAGTDCAGFVSAALALSGLRITPNKDDYNASLATAETFMNMGSKKDCLRPVEFKGTNTIQSGDLIAWNTHVMMIDQVGEDPFGIERSGKIKSIDDCKYKNLDPAYFNFTIINSASIGGIGVSRMDAKVFFKLANRSPLTQFAVSACRAKFEQKKSTKAIQYIEKNTRLISIIRHVGTSRAECMRPSDTIPEVLGESCIADCLKKYEEELSK